MTRVTLHLTDDELTALMYAIDSGLNSAEYDALWEIIDNLRDVGAMIDGSIKRVRII